MESENFRKNIQNHMSLMQHGMLEHCLEPFEELLKSNPGKALRDFPKFVESALSMGNNFYRGLMCGGPAPEVTIPFLNLMGEVYPLLDTESRKLALRNSLKILDRLNYESSQMNMEYLNEPWLAGDILINRWIYWCGFQRYIQSIKDAVIWGDLKPEIVREDQENGKDILNVNSEFWFAYTLSTKDYGKDAIRDRFLELFPGIMGRTLDAIAANTAYYSANFALNPRVSKEEKVPYKIGIETKLNNFAPELKDQIRAKINEKKWILFPTDLVSEEIISFLEGEKSII